MGLCIQSLIVTKNNNECLLLLKYTARYYAYAFLPFGLCIAKRLLFLVIWLLSAATLARKELTSDDAEMICLCSLQSIIFQQASLGCLSWQLATFSVGKPKSV